ncbi:MAG: magnesium transporter [Planctomycetes bacterium]|nr:magnesium transporter [Planctomycetota bacterium]
MSTDTEHKNQNSGEKNNGTPVTNGNGTAATRHNQNKSLQKLEQLSDIKTARRLELLQPRIAAKRINEMTRPDIADVVRHIDSALFAEMAPYISTDKLKEILPKMASNDLTEIALNLPSNERERFFDCLATEQVETIRQQLLYPEDTAGSMMDTKVITFPKSTTINEAISKIRKAPHTMYSYVYVVDEHKKLEGVVSLRNLLVSEGKVTLEQIMNRDILKVSVQTDRRELSLLMQEHEYMSLPVIDSNGMFLGIVRHDDVLKAVEEEASEDVQKLFGAGADEKVTSSIRYSMKKRLPWLTINLMSAFLVAAVVSTFEHVIARYTLIAILMPIVAGQGGNTGSQSLAVIIRALALKELEGLPVKLLIRNIILGLANGALIATLTFSAVYLWQGNFKVACIISAAMIVNMTVATLAGMLIPVVLKAFKFDPAQGSSVILTTITDCTGFASFLGFAHLFL